MGKNNQYLPQQQQQLKEASEAPVCLYIYVCVQMFVSLSLKLDVIKQQHYHMKANLSLQLFRIENGDSHRYPVSAVTPIKTGAGQNLAAYFVFI